jgi:hypothetical protein
MDIIQYYLESENRMLRAGGSACMPHGATGVNPKNETAS